jgi:hypothetical protein
MHFQSAGMSKWTQIEISKAIPIIKIVSLEPIYYSTTCDITGIKANSWDCVPNEKSYFTI